MRKDVSYQGKHTDSAIPRRRHRNGGPMDIVFIALTVGVFIAFAAFAQGVEKL